jgi:hypothetical protein
VTAREKSSAAVTIKKRAPRKAAAPENKIDGSFGSFVDPDPRLALIAGTAAPETKVDASFTSFVDPDQRLALIAEAAYFRAERRGFAPGGETQDWLAAEAEIDARLLRDTGSTPRV